jgi:3-oxoacyl-[acyl-carrier-protein] synthase II
MKKRQVCVSGMGLITPLGGGDSNFWKNLLAGKTAIRTTNIFKFPIDPNETPLHMAASLDHQVISSMKDDISEDLYWGDRLLYRATKEAIDDAELSSLPSDTAVIIGGGASSTLNIEEFEAQLALDIAQNRPLTKLPLAILSSEKILANRFGLWGPKVMVATACSSSSLALSYACDLITMGECSSAIVGCADTLCQLTHSGFYGLKSIAPDRCKPFDQNRRGISIGEAAIILILESSEQVRQRKREAYCTLEGYSANCDAERMTSPDETGEVWWRLMQRALENASILPQDVGYVCAHGTGTVVNDLTESKAIQQLFGTDSATPPVSSIKGAVGHCMAAAGIFNCAVVSLALKHQVLPPNTGLEKKDRGCSITILTKARKADCKVAIANAFAFGGNNACLVFKRWEKGGACNG